VKKHIPPAFASIFIHIVLKYIAKKEGQRTKNLWPS